MLDLARAVSGIFFGKISNFSLAQFAKGITLRNKIMWLSMIITLSFSWTFE